MLQAFWTYVLLTTPVLIEIPIDSGGRLEMPSGWRYHVLINAGLIEIPANSVVSVLGLDIRNGIGLVIQFIVGSLTLTWLLLIVRRFARRCRVLISTQ